MGMGPDWSSVVGSERQRLELPKPAPPSRVPETCSQQALDTICHQVQEAIDKGCTSLAVIVSPGSFNPVHCEHVRTLELARSHLEQRGVAVVGGFLQPSSDMYVCRKVGPEWAICLGDRITTCELAARANASTEHDGKVWIHAWRGGEEDGFFVPGVVEQFLNDTVPGQLGAKLPAPITVYMVCGADLVVRSNGWDETPDFPIVVLQPPGIALPTSCPAAGWEVADGEMKPISSTRIRDAIAAGQWNQLVNDGCENCVVDFMAARHKEGTLFIGQSR